MSTSYDPPTWPGQPPLPPPPPPHWQWQVPGGPGGPVGPGRPSHRIRRGLIVAVVAAAIGAGASLFGLQHSAGMVGTELTTAQVADRVDPGLVDIVTTLGYQHAEAAGTGIVLTSSGEILTNNHVIEGATSITATDVGNGQSYRAKVVGYDRGHDIAVLK
ncbi:MAG TPA: S1C family serine protease, partial [Streptosporangiaceae bacterium]|nr:S1C family serine protease [Streptosporangiaceae bacterium]